MPIQWVINGCAVNALTIKEENIKEIIPDNYRRLRKQEIVKAGDQVANICGKVTWAKVSGDEVGHTSRLAGRIIIRKTSGKKVAQ